MSEEQQHDFTPPAELVIRETTLYRLSKPEDRAAALSVGRLLHLFALERPAPPAPEGSESAIHAALRAVALDVRNLQGFLGWLCREGDDTERGRSAIALTDRAGSYAQTLGRLADSIESELAGVEPQARAGETS